MSKSLGNFVTIDELLSSHEFGSNMWHGRVLRLAMLLTHYRQPIDWTVDRLVETRSMLSEWIGLAHGLGNSIEPPAELVESLSDDLNTAAAMSVLHGLGKSAKSDPSSESYRALGSALKFLGVWGDETSLDVLGYGYEVGVGPSVADVGPLINFRLDARRAKNWAESDRIRDELAAMGIAIKDNKDGTTSWEVKR